MKKRYKRTFLVLYAFCSLLAEGVSAQSLVLSLEKTISLAADSSLEAFRTKNLFLSGYWEFRNYKAERLPSLTLNITPAEYYRDITKRYDSEKDIDEYRKQQSFYAGGNLKIKRTSICWVVVSSWIRIWGICAISARILIISSPPFQSVSDTAKIYWDTILSGGRRRIEPLKYEENKERVAL